MLELLVQGITSNRELAAHLFVSENTIKYHLRHILDKLHLQNRAQVIAYALRHGLGGAAGLGPLLTPSRPESPCQEAMSRCPPIGVGAELPHGPAPELPAAPGWC